jgi:hypothetical protein
MSVPEVAERLGAPMNEFFVVMDSRSAEDDTVLLVMTTASDGGTSEVEGGGLKTVRTTFTSAQSVIVALCMGTQGVEEVQFIAARDPGGVYSPEKRNKNGGPRKGEPAPRMALGKR